MCVVPCLVFSINCNLYQTVLFCRDKPTLVLCADFNIFVYTTSPTGFWVWCHILQGTGKTWQTSQQRSLQGLIQPMFPPRNPGRLTGNRPNSPKATTSQPLPSPHVSPLPKNLSGDFSLCFSQTNYLSNTHSSSPHPFSSSLPSARLSIVGLSCFSLQAIEQFY